MLILTRKKDEVIVINNDIKIRIVDIRSDGVKLGVEAPPHVKVYRKELWDNIQAENIVAVEKAKDHISNEVASKLGSKVQKELHKNNKDSS